MVEKPIMKYGVTCDIVSKKGENKMNKSKWYYENTRTGEITDIMDAANWWAESGDTVNFWHWSEYSQQWVVLMTREP